MTQFVMTQEMIQQFLDQLQQEGKKQRVIMQYQRELQGLEKVSEDQGQIIDQKILEQWKQELVKKGYAKGTITNKVVKINHFLKSFGYEMLCFQRGGKKDLIGHIFGNLTVLHEAVKRSSDRSVLWTCRCNLCGKEKDIPTNQLIKGVHTSCGCEKSVRLQETNGYIDGTCLKNVFSNKINKNNTSGHKGVYRKRDKWAAKIQYKKKTYYLGTYDRLEDAVSARKEAENLVRDEAVKLLEKIKNIQ